MMEKRVFSWMIGLSLFLGIILGQQTIVHADVQTQTADFEIQPILPEEQVNASLNYFDLLLKPDSTRVIQMRIQNFSNKKITVESSLRNAYTQMGGNIDFTTDSSLLDKSLKTSFTQIATLTKGDQKIVLKAGETKMLSTTIKMPKAGYKGMIYGDWHFLERLKPDTKTTATTSNYAYSVGVVLRGTDYEVYPKLSYGETAPILYRRHPAMGIKLRNTQPMAITKASVDATILQKGFNGSKHVYKATNLSIAPNSLLNIPISWSYNTLKPGDYEIQVKVKGLTFFNKFPHTWEFNKKFTVADSAVKTINKQAMQKPINHWFYGAIVSGALLAISSGFLVYVVRLKH